MTSVSTAQPASDVHMASAAKLEALFEDAADAIFIADLDGRYTEVNRGACALLGYERHELVGKTIADLLPPEDVPRLAAAREMLLEPGRTQLAEWTLRRKDGSFVPVEVSAKILPDGRWLGFVRDITERKRAEESLRHSEAALAAAQRVAKMGSWEWNLETKEVHRSPGFFALFGVAPDPMYEGAFTLTPYIHPDDRAQVYKVVTEAARDARPYTLEHRLVRADGTERWVVQQGEFVVENGRTVRGTGTMIDITDRKRVEREREEAMRRLQAVLDQCPVGIVIIEGAHGEKVQINERAKAILGHDMRDAEDLAQGARQLRLPSGEPLEERPALRALRGARVEQMEIVVHREDAATPVSINAAPIVNGSGAIEGAVVTLEDITAYKKLEQLRAEWGSVIAHDLRQPLNGIRLHAQLLRRKTRDMHDLSGFVDRIDAAAIRMTRMIEDLMDLSRLEAGRLVIDRRPTDVEQVVRDSAAQIALEAPTRPVEVRAVVPVPRASVDRDRIAQVMENLLTNAVKYGAEATPIVVTIEAHGDEIAIAVTNEGRGITPADAARVFDRFERTAEARTGQAKGAGLGLYITRGLVEAHGGRIAVTSAPEGPTTFRFTLPVT